VSRANKIANILGVGIPVVAFVASIYLLWGRYVNGVDLATLAVAYFLTCLGISIGFHRLLTHRAYQTYRPVRYALAVLGSMAMQGPVIAWVADHRKHHNFSDEEGDPHSPHVGRGSGVLGAIRGLYHAHVGWLFSGENRADQEKYAKDLLTEPAMHRISRWFFWIVGLSLVLPFLAGWALTGRVGGGLQTMFWGGLIRIFALHHITFSVNSICHFIGRRRFQGDRRVAERLVARTLLARRSVASQPPRVSELGLPRPQDLGGRRLRLGHPRSREHRPRVEGRPDQPRAPGSEARDALTLPESGAAK